MIAGEESYARWRQSNVRPQKQFGFVTATVTVPLGDLTSEQMRVLGELAARVRRWHRAGNRRPEPGSSLGAGW